MNERIKELAQQAGLPSAGEPVGSVRPRATNKFAELIVRECIIKAEQEEDRFSEMGEHVLAFVMQNFQNLLKEHFGVE